MKLNKLFGEDIDISQDEFAEAVKSILLGNDGEAPESIKSVSCKVIWNVSDMMLRYRGMLESREIESPELRKILKEIVRLSVWVCHHARMESTEDILDYLTCTLIRKNQDYGNSAIKNGGLVGNYVRMSDKVSRIVNILNNADINYESLEDSWLDLAGYATIGLIILRLTEKVSNDG